MEVGKIEQLTGVLTLTPEGAALLGLPQRIEMDADVTGEIARLRAELEEVKAEVERLKGELNLLRGIDVRQHNDPADCPNWNDGCNCMAHEVLVLRTELAELKRERFTLDEIQNAVNFWCSCGGRGPDDPGVCMACLILHRLARSRREEVHP